MKEKKTTKTNSKTKIEPQEGFQTKFLSTPVDIALGGGGAGVGKTFAEILESLRFIGNPNFSALFFRRTFNQIIAPGGLWHEAEKFYPEFGATSSKNVWKFPSGATCVFSHMQYEKNKFDWQGSQIPLIIFDELTHFTRGMFFYMLSRNRSTCGVKPYIRATCNPDADSWVRDFIDWYIDDNGYVIPERSGVIRYFTVKNDEVIWGSTRKEVLSKATHLQNMPNPLRLIKSFTFIEGDINENKILLDINPEYLANLMALSEEDQLRLLKRNWNVKLDKNIIINYVFFKDIFSNHVKPGKRYITADIATKGSDFLSIWVWEGKRAIDLILFDNNNGKQAVEAITSVRLTYNIPESHVCFDADGVGGGLTGYLPNAIEFHGGGKVIGIKNYKNLRAQCYFEFANCINQNNGKTPDDAYSISPEILERSWAFDFPGQYKGRKIQWVLLHQLKAIRQNNPDGEDKLAIIPKVEMKEYLGGISPDLFDSLMMRERFELIKPFEQNSYSKESLGIF